MSLIPKQERILARLGNESASHAFVGAMVGVAVLIPDVGDGGGGVYPQSPDAHRIRFLLDLRGGAQFQPHG